LLEDFQRDEAAKLGNENTAGMTFAIGAGVLKTLVAWPFFSNILKGTHMTGMIPTVAGLLGAAFAGVVTTGAVWWWYRALNNQFPARPAAAVFPASKSPILNADGRFVSQLHRSLNRHQQTHPVVSGVIFVVLSAALCFLWLRWR